MASVVGPFRYCMRHPKHTLFILLLLVLVVASRLLFSSVPEQRNIQALNLMSGTLSQQLGRKTKPHGRIYDSGTDAGKNPTPFEEGVKTDKVALKKTAKGEIAIHREHENVIKNDNKKRKPNHQPKLKQGVRPSQEFNVLMVLAKVGQTSPLAQRFQRCFLSICMQSTVNLRFYVVADEVGKLICQRALSQARKASKIGINVTYYDVKRVAERVRPIVKDIQQFFSSGDPNSYYNDPLFFISTAIHHILPQKVKQIIWVDSDLYFQSDIKELFSEFDKFKSFTVFGLAHEQQPVYQHVLYMFRNQNPETKVGGPPPYGLQGFNSGVILMNVHHMRNSKLYKNLLQGSEVKKLADKYSFQGHLGDQDFYSLLSLEYSELFHVLPCQWNRQLCTYWKDKYPDVFDLYFNCSGPIHVYHGNCGAKMPNE